MKRTEATPRLAGLSCGGLREADAGRDAGGWQRIRGLCMFILFCKGSREGLTEVCFVVALGHVFRNQHPS